LLKLLFEENNSNLLFLFGLIYEIGFETKVNQMKALQFYKRSFEMGNDHAIGRLLNCIHDFPPFWNDLSQTVDFFKELTIKNNVHGIYCLGVCYEEGVGIEKNETESKRLFEIAASLNDSKAIERLSIHDDLLKFYDHEPSFYLFPCN
jgi:TPR repeat protein